MNSRRSPSLSLRLVALYGMLVAAALLVVAGAVMYLTRAHLTHQLDAGLRRTAASFAEGPALSVGSAQDLEGAAREWLKVLPLPAGQLAEIRTSTPPRVLSIGGALDLEDFPGGPELLDATESGWHRIGEEDPRLRVLAVPLSVQGRQIGTLVAAASERDIVSTLSAVQGGIAAASAATLFLAALLGFFTVRRTLRPLAQISAEAQAIQETGDLQRRVANAGPPDEVGRLAEVFDRMLDKLQDSFASQQRFLADASHELRTPMTVIRGQLELLQHEISSEDGRRSVGVGIDELDRMSRIVEDLLLLARLEEGMTLVREPVEVELVLQEAMLRGLLIAPREIEVDARPGLFVLADADRLLQVVSNLVTNALHHAGPKATIGITSRSQQGRVLVEVSDTGSGIPPEDIPHIFERLYRGSAPKTDAPSGAGLGLAIAASLTEAMGGEIRATSTPGVGTTFSITLSAAPEQTELPQGSRRAGAADPS